MVNANYRKIAFVSSYLPRRCGIASFCGDLIRNVTDCAATDFDPLVVAMISNADLQYREPVMFETRRNVRNDYLSAADFINFSHVDVVSIQHEYGLFGGEDGTHLSLLLENVKAPVVTTMHTVLRHPTTSCLRATAELCELSDTVVVMNRRAVQILKDTYGVDPTKVRFIPHGIPDLPFVDSSYYKHKFGIEDRRTILTFGLLSRNKGIEDMLRALPTIIQADPSVLYIILGATHPEIIRQQGEEYRFELQRLVEELDLQSHVMFHNQFVSDEKLGHFLCAADLYVTPYRNPEQITSGTLAYAVGAGKAVISTPYLAAEDLLSEGGGKLVPFNDPDALARTVCEILTDDRLFRNLRRRAYDFSRSMIWPRVGREYWNLFGAAKHRIVRPLSAVPKTALLQAQTPEPSLEHLVRMTDDTGLLQHASFILANRRHGYCTDDNARAVVAMVQYFTQYPDPEALRLLNIYLSFICHAQRPDGTFYNLMSYDRRWLDDEPDHDGLSRSLWAIGTVIARPPQQRMVPILKDIFDRSIPLANSLSPRSRAYAIFGMSQYLRRFPGASEIKRCLHTAAEFLLSLLSHADDDWMWFEDILCYDNAAMPHALFDAWLVTRRQEYLQAAVRTCDFLLSHIFCRDRFSFIGCNGWFCKGRTPARFDQQPLDAMETVRMLRTAYEATSDPRYRMLQQKAFNWFLGENDLSVPLYDFGTAGCCDGLTPTGVNLNQGAESTLSFLLALLTVLESDTPRQNRSSNPKIVAVKAARQTASQHTPL